MDKRVDIAATSYSGENHSTAASGRPALRQAVQAYSLPLSPVVVERSTATVATTCWLTPSCISMGCWIGRTPRDPCPGTEPYAQDPRGKRKWPVFAQLFLGDFAQMPMPWRASERLRGSLGGGVRLRQAAAAASFRGRRVAPSRSRPVPRARLRAGRNAAIKIRSTQAPSTNR